MRVSDHSSQGLAVGQIRDLLAEAERLGISDATRVRGKVSFRGWLQTMSVDAGDADVATSIADAKPQS